MDDLPRRDGRERRTGPRRAGGDLYQRLEAKRISVEAERRAYARRASDREDNGTAVPPAAHTDADDPSARSSSD
jgi:hypothetical protein